MQDKCSVQEVVVVLVLQVVNIKGMGFAVQMIINNSFVLAAVGLHAPLAVSTKVMVSANQMTTNNSSLQEAVGPLVPLVVNTKGMVSAEVTNC